MEGWNEHVPKDVFNERVASMPSRLQTVIDGREQMIIVVENNGRNLVGDRFIT